MAFMVTFLGGSGNQEVGNAQGDGQRGPRAVGVVCDEGRGPLPPRGIGSKARGVHGWGRRPQASRPVGQDPKPRDEAERRLRAAFQVFHLLLAEDSAHVVRAWFIGMNPQLDDDSPAEAIRDGRLKDTLAAAKAFIAGG